MRLSAQPFRHFAVDDALREALDDRGLADAGLADQHGIVLGAALQHLHGAADLVVAADHGIELALLGALGEIDRVLLERLPASPRRSGPSTFSPPRTSSIAFSIAPFTAPALRRIVPSWPLVFERREHEQLAGDVLVAALLRELVGDVEERLPARSRDAPRRRMPSTFGRRSSASPSCERSRLTLAPALSSRCRTEPPC